MAAADIKRNRFGVDARLWEALHAIVINDADMASHKNFVGAAQCHTGPFHDIAQNGFENLTRGQAVWLYKALRTYSKTQLPAAGIDYSAIEDPSQIATQPKKPEGARITRAQDGALIFRSPKDHAAIALVRALRERRWTGAEGTPPFCWRLALERANLDGLRELYRLGTVDFSPEAIAALRGLSATPAAQNGRDGAPSPRPVDAAPTAAQAPTNGTAPTVPTARASLEKQGQPTQPQGMVRVAYVVADDNTIVYRLKFMPANVTLAGHFTTVQDAQAAADALNKKLLKPVELS